MKDAVYCNSILKFFIYIVRDAYWPGGVLAEEYPERSESVKLRTRVTAKTMMLGSLPG